MAQSPRASSSVRAGGLEAIGVDDRRVDDGLVGWSRLRPFIEFDSNLVGRSTVIEDAKTLVCDRYGISRGEAFTILRRASSHSNRKLRDVAGRLVAESARR